jgi:hypothetical protein
MNTPDSIKIITRFYEAIEELKSMRKIEMYKDFLDRYDIQKTAFYEARRVKESDRFQVAWLAYLINDYEISPEWLMSGKGKMFR